MKQVLYAKDNAGNVLSWEISIINKNTSCSLYLSYGRLDGKKQLNWEHNITGVNIGRSNETTPLEQAKNRLKSRVTNRKRKGYVELTPQQELTVSTARSEEFVIGYLETILPDYREDLDGEAKPMLASQYYRKKANWTDPYGKLWKDRKYFYIQNPYEVKEEKAVVAKFPMYGQPKINGVRAKLKLNNLNKAKLKSKEGLTYHAPTHILNYAQANKAMFLDGEVVLDGELYIYGESLQVIQSAVKSIDLNTPRLIYIVYDIMIEGNSNEERWKYLKERTSSYFDMAHIELIRTYMIKSDEQAQRMCDKFIKEGHEGIILRDLKANYNFGSRRINMLKLKRSISEDFTIIRIEPQPKRPDLALFVCSHKEVEFRVNPTYNEGMKAYIMANPKEFIGKKLQTSFYEWTDAGKPLHLIETIIRDYE